VHEFGWKSIWRRDFLKRSNSRLTTGNITRSWTTNNSRSNAGDVMNTDISRGTSLKTQTWRKKMEKDGNNQEKEDPNPKLKAQGTKIQPHTTQGPRK